MKATKCRKAWKFDCSATEPHISYYETYQNGPRSKIYVQRLVKNTIRIAHHATDRDSVLFGLDNNMRRESIGLTGSHLDGKSLPWVVGLLSFKLLILKTGKS